MTSQLMQNKDYHSLSLTVWVPCLYHKRWLHRSAGNLITIWTNFGGDMTFRPRLTKYSRGCVPGIPGGVDAYEARKLVVSRALCAWALSC